MRIVDLAIKDLTQLVRDWKAAAFQVVMPIAFTLLFGFVFGGFGSEADPRLPIAFLDQDAGGPLSSSLLDLLAASDLVRPVVQEGGDINGLEKQVRDGEMAAAVIVPAGYSEQILEGNVVSLEAIIDQASSAGTTAQNELQTAVNRLLGSVQAALLSTQEYARQAEFPNEATRQQFLQEALDRAIGEWAHPPLTVSTSRSGAIEEDPEETAYSENAFAHSSPSMMVQFAIAGLLGAGEILVLERKSKALKRLLTTAISRWEIILGHFLAMFVMIFLQLALLIGFGQVFLQLDYLREPLATLLVMVTMALWTAGLGLLIGVISRKEEHVIVISLTLMFVLSGVGGAWMPLEFTSPAFQTVGHLLPSAWAIDGLENIVARGLGLSSVWLPAGLMLAYAVVFFALATWYFRFE